MLKHFFALLLAALFIAPAAYASTGTVAPADAVISADDHDDEHHDDDDGH